MSTVNKCSTTETPVSDNGISEDYTIIYVLGGPGSGKGTQCANISKHYGFCHLSVGELLQREVDSGCEYKTVIESCGMDGKLVPTDLVIDLLKQATAKSPIKKFLIDGFPRNLENLHAAEEMLKIEPEYVLFLECSKETLMNRLLNRKQGRADDNEETVIKRLQVFYDSTLPVIEYYSSKGKVLKVDGERTKEEVFEAIKSILSAYA